MTPRSLPSVRLLAHACAALLVLAACAATDADDHPTDPEDASFLDGKSDGGCAVEDGTDEARGVLALASDPTIDAGALHDLGLSWRTARALEEHRPYASLASLDAVRYVGPQSCRALRTAACDAQGLCERDLGVWTWNIEHFPLRAGTVASVAEVLATHDVEIVGFEEVDSLDAWAELLERLPGWSGLPGRTGFDTQVALAVRDDRVRVLATEDLFTDDSWRFPRPPLAITLEVAGRAGARTITVVVVHLKAMVDATSQRRRRDAIRVLERWAAGRRTAGQELILVGDWNDDVDDRAEDNVFQPFLDAPEAYALPTVALAADGAYSYIPFRRLIDHLVFTQEAAQHFVPVRTEVVRLDLERAGYEDTVSDHLPVASTVWPILPAP